MKLRTRKNTVGAMCAMLAVGAMFFGGVTSAQTTTTTTPSLPVVPDVTYSSTTISYTSVPDVPNTGAVQESEISMTAIVIGLAAFILIVALLLIGAARRPDVSINRFDDGRGV